jgi:hypothetical protein
LSIFFDYFANILQIIDSLRESGGRINRVLGLFSPALLISALLECVLEIAGCDGRASHAQAQLGKKETGLVPGIHDLLFLEEDVDGRIKSGHDTVS